MKTLKGKFISNDTFITESGEKYDITPMNYSVVPLNKVCFVAIKDMGGWFMLDDVVL